MNITCLPPCRLRACVHQQTAVQLQHMRDQAWSVGPGFPSSLEHCIVPAACRRPSAVGAARRGTAEAGAEAGKTDTDAGMAICDRDLQSRRVSGEKETDIGILE